MTDMNTNIALKIKPETDNSEVEFYRAGTVIGGAKIVPPAKGFYSMDVFGFSRLDPPELQYPLRKLLVETSVKEESLAEKPNPPHNSETFIKHRLF